MKKLQFLIFVLIVVTLVLSACGATPSKSASAPVTTSASTKVEAMPVAFVGIVDSMAGDQWVISGTTVTVDASIVRDGPFNVGDQVKVEGLVHPDGTFTISRVESPATPVAVDNANDATSNANTNDASLSNVNDGNSNDSSASNSNDSNSNDDDNSNDDRGGNSNDDNSNDDNDSNSNDDNGNDDNSGKGGGDDEGGDDKDDNSNGG